MDKRLQERTQRMAIGLTAVAFLLLHTGCLSLRSAQSADPVPRIGGDEILEANEEVTAFSMALAHYAQAHVHELNQRHDLALIHYQRALALDPDHNETYLRMALLLIRDNESDAAVALLQQLATRRPDSAQPFIWLGSTYRHVRDIHAAIGAYRSALERDPGNTGIYMQLVDLHLQRSEEQEAMDVLKEGLKQADDQAPLYRVLGELYMRQAGLATDPEKARARQEEAMLAFEAALDHDPYEGAVLNSLGDLYLRSRRIPEAVDVFVRLSTLFPEDLAAKERLALSYELTGEWEQAVRVLEEMARMQPTNPRLFVALGSVYERIGEEEKALLNYRLAARLGPADPAPYLKLGALQIEDDPAAAETALREGLALLPDHPHLLEMLGYVCFNAAKYAEAIEAFERAEQQLELDDDLMTSPNFHLYFALSHYFEDAIDEAAERLGHAMAINPDALEAFTHFIFQDEDENRLGEAMRVFDALRRAQPEDPFLPATQAYMYCFGKDYAAALPLFSEAYALALDAQDDRLLDNPRFFFWYGAAQEREGHIEEAETFFHKSLALDPDNAEAYNYLAYMWAEKGINLDKAKEYVRIALDRRPDSGAFIDTLGWIYYQIGRYEEAYEEIRRAAELIPDDPTILDHLGDIYLKLDQPEKAKEKWTRSYLADSENEDVARKLAEYGVDVSLLITEEQEADVDTAAPPEEPSDEPLQPEEEVEQPSPDSVLQNLSGSP